jgi:hypothetical protein
MMSVTSEEYVQQELVAQRDEELGVSREHKRQVREGYLPKDGFEPDEAADQWKKTGKAIVFKPVEVDVQT